MKLTEILKRIIESYLISDDKILNLFLNKLLEKGSLSKGFSRDEFIYNDIASLKFDRFEKKDRNEISLGNIAVFDKGIGNGSKIMKDITVSADELGMKITLSAKPFGRDSKALGSKELIYFYKKNGFEVSPSFLKDLEFDSEKDAIEYVLQYPSEGLDMERDPR